MTLILKMFQGFLTSTRGSSANELIFALPAALIVTLGSLGAGKDVLASESQAALSVLSSAADVYGARPDRP